MTRDEMVSEIKQLVNFEIEAQDNRWGWQVHSPIEWVAILVEEVGEASQQSLYVRYGGDVPNVKDDAIKKIVDELVQCAAVAIQAAADIRLTGEESR